MAYKLVAVLVDITIPDAPITGPDAVPPALSGIEEIKDIIVSGAASDGFDVTWFINDLYTQVGGTAADLVVDLVQQ